MRTLSVIIALSIAGCGPLTVQPSGPDNPSPIVVPETLFTVLADAIDNPKTLPKNTTQLELMLRHLRSVQAITDEQVAAVKSLVDCSKEVELTPQDAMKIRGVK
jgi:hypothetical protein